MLRSDFNNECTKFGTDAMKNQKLNGAFQLESAQVATMFKHWTNACQQKNDDFNDYMKTMKLNHGRHSIIKIIV